MDNTGLSPEETQRLNEKFDIMLQELKSWRKKFEEKFLNVDKKSDSLESIIKRLENKIAKLDSDNENESVAETVVEEKCEKCQGNMVLKTGPYGKYIECTECKNRKKFIY